MGLAEMGVLATMMMMGLCGLTNATKYTVGGPSGWRLLGGGNDYQAWVANHTFVVGDVLDFKFNKSHSVKLVFTEEDYNSCNPDSASITYSTGSAFFFLGLPGDYYFFCGFSNHCQAGMKIHIWAHPSNSSSSSSSSSSQSHPPMAANAPPITFTSAAPSPHHSSFKLSVCLVTVVTFRHFFHLLLV